MFKEQHSLSPSLKTAPYPVNHLSRVKSKLKGTTLLLSAQCLMVNTVSTPAEHPDIAAFYKTSRIGFAFYPYIQKSVIEHFMLKI